ncbi:MAG: HEPN domain-containing protein [Bacteroidota bacterium]|nr:HEPN domain-containing protein [Bacteroidota bacterium]
MTMFNNEELNRQYRRIESLIKLTKEIQPDNVLRSHLTKYICVLCSGFIENSIYHTFSDIAESSCTPSVVLTYTKSQLYKIQNANTEKIKELAKSFNPDWYDRIRDFMQDQDRGAAINYILKDRHNIAHGRESTITISKLEEYLIKTVQVIKYIEYELNANV